MKLIFRSDGRQLCGRETVLPHKVGTAFATKNFAEGGNGIKGFITRPYHLCSGCGWTYLVVLPGVPDGNGLHLAHHHIEPLVLPDAPLAEVEREKELT